WFVTRAVRPRPRLASAQREDRQVIDAVDLADVAKLRFIEVTRMQLRAMSRRRRATLTSRRFRSPCIGCGWLHDRRLMANSRCSDVLAGSAGVRSPRLTGPRDGPGSRPTRRHGGC